MCDYHSNEYHSDDTILTTIDKVCVIYVCVRVCDICYKLLQIVVPRSSRVDTFCDNRQSVCDIGVCAHSNDYHSNDKCVCDRCS